MKHTKGPWWACCSDDGAYSHYVFGEESDKTICRMLSNDPNDKEHEYEHLEGIVTLDERQANARLIAAAPDLLELLNECRDSVAECANYEAQYESHRPDRAISTVKTLEKIDAILAKLTGE